MSSVHEVSAVWDVAGHPYWIGAVAILVLYVIQSEVRFGERARKGEGEATDRGSSIALSIAALVLVLGFVFATYPEVAPRPAGLVFRARAARGWPLARGPASP